MKTTNYQSVPVIASVIGSKSRKAMFLINITSINGDKMFPNTSIPTTWKSFNTRPTWRYTNLRYGLNNVEIHAGKYYKFDFDSSVLMTDSGPVGPHGQSLKVEGLTKTQTPVRQYVEWEEHSQSLVEFPLSKATPAMDIDYSTWKGNCSMITSRLIDNKVHKYLQLLDRYIIYVPLFIYKNWSARFVAKDSTHEFINDDSQETIIEQTAHDSAVAEKFNYIDRTQMYTSSSVEQNEEERLAYIKFERSQSLQQWEQDNPEYQSFI